MGFPFLFAICTAATITIGFVDIEKGREDCRRFTEQRKVDRVVAESGLSADAILKGNESDVYLETRTTDRIASNLPVIIIIICYSFLAPCRL